MAADDVAARLAALPPAKRALVERQLALESRRPKTFDVSVTQQGLWFLEQLVGGSPLYVLGWRVELEGRLDHGALHAALNDAVARHGALRTRFETRDGRPVQVVLPEVRVPLPLDDLRALPPEQRTEAVERTVARETATGFDLTVAPLLRARLLRLGDERWALLLLVHHIVFDAASFDILLAELADTYAARMSGRRPELPPPPVQYADFSRWQRQLLSGPSLERLLAYWRAQLDGTPGVLELPIAAARPAVQAFDGGTHEFTLPAGLVDRLRALAREERATLFMVLLAAYQVLLFRYSGQDDVSVGSTVSGRTREDLQRTIGFFLTTLVLRGDLGGNPAFRRLLRQVRRTCLDAFAHQDIPFDRLVEDLAPDRTLSHNPLFQVSFDLIQEGEPARRFGDLTLRDVELLDVAMSKFDLSLTAVDSGGDVHLTVEYSAETFAAGAIERLARHYVELLESVAADPDGRIEELRLLPSDERRLLLEQWNDTGDAAERLPAVHETVRARARASPDAVALIHDGRDVTYAELAARAHRLACRLRQLGAGPGQLVGICLERSPELVVAVLAVFEAGAGYVALDPGYPDERLAYVMADSGVGVVLTAQRLRARVDGDAVQVVCVDDAPTAAGSPAGQDAGAPAAVHPDALAYVIYTSGSTGRPKGAMNTHGNLANQIAWVQGVYGLDERDCVLHKTPLGFDDSVREICWSLTSGARLAIAAGDGHRDPAYLARLIAEQQVTVLHVVPSLLTALLDEPLFAACGSSLRLVICSGEVLPPQLQRRFLDTLDADLVNHYGPTEAGVDVTSWRCRRDAGDEPVPIGRPGANTRAYVLDRHAQPVPVGVPGELFIGGPQVCRGYLRRPGLTAERFVPDPYAARAGSRLYRTGDICRWRADGQIEYVGRADHQVKIRGIRVEPEEVESLLAEHPDVQAAVVVARAEAGGQPSLVGYVVGTGGEAPGPSRLRSHLAAMLPPAMIPAAFVTLPALPLTTTGKVDRQALPAPDSDRPQLDAVYVPPRTPVEQVLAQVWSDVLELERVGVEDDFFELGGHSLLATRAAALCAELLGGEVPVSLLFSAPTIGALAHAVTERHPDAAQLEAAAGAVLEVLALSDDEVRTRLSADDGATPQRG